MQSSGREVRWKTAEHKIEEFKQLRQSRHSRKWLILPTSGRSVLFNVILMYSQFPVEELFKMHFAKQKQKKNCRVQTVDILNTKNTFVFVENKKYGK